MKYGAFWKKNHISVGRFDHYDNLPEDNYYDELPPNPMPEAGFKTLAQKISSYETKLDPEEVKASFDPLYPNFPADGSYKPLKATSDHY